ncbi:MAG TPA: UvrD-helicase domain-containing protein, partial [Parachlamydiaceae bacterium]|nr:UvrD-helicase domain-containing protein [Parachlamydiaceae bacterium]
MTHAPMNIEQQSAVDTIYGPLLVLAGAGSGKTRVVTFRIVKILEQGARPSEILGLTFTNKAAGEMKERVRQLTHHHVLICTFHSLGARILRESIHVLGYMPGFTIYDEQDVEKIMKVCLSEMNSPTKLESKLFLKLISNAKNALQEPGDIEPNTLEEDEKYFPEVYTRYQAKLKEYNALDFDDLLYLPVKLFKEHPEVLEHYQKRWSFLLIDEYQDTNAAQYTIVRHLVAKHQNLCVVGDPDQSIYSWRGANIQNILGFEKDYPGAKVVR